MVSRAGQTCHRSYNGGRRGSQLGPRPRGRQFLDAGRVHPRRSLLIAEFSVRAGKLRAHAKDIVCSRCRRSPPLDDGHCCYSAVSARRREVELSIRSWPSCRSTSISTSRLPPIDGGGGGDIIESRFDGAFIGGFSVAGGRWRADLNFLWAAVGGDRIETPVLTVDADVFLLPRDRRLEAGQGLVPDWWRATASR